MAHEITLHPLEAADRDAVLALDQSAFAFDVRNVDPEADTAWIEWDRAWSAHIDGEMAGIYVVFTYGLTVPAPPPEGAAVVPMAGLSWVAVHPDHRRRGLLSAMIGHHLHDLYDSAPGEAVSCLFASEPGIYGRFGYGLSTDDVRVTLPAKSPLRPLRGSGRVTTHFESADPAMHDKIVQQVYERASLLRPGYTIRPAVQWQRHLADPPARRPSGAEALKIVVARRDGEPTGYAVLRRSPSWGDHAPEGKVRVGDLQAVDPESAHALWRRVLDLDLMAEVTTPALPPDHPFLAWAAESGAVAAHSQGLWTRLVDVGTALAQRGYTSEVDVVLDVTDSRCPWNAHRWRLAADATGSSCEPTGDPADLALDVRELGSAYLGGTTLATLATAGLVDELTPGALARASAAMRSPLEPATPYMF